MARYGFKNKNVAVTLKEVAYERMLQSKDRSGASIKDSSPQQTRSFIVILDESIAAATVSGGDWTIHSGMGKVYYREFLAGEGSSQDPGEDVSIPEPNLVPWYDDDDIQIEKRVWNHLPVAAAPNYPFMVLQDVHGDLYIPGVITATAAIPLGIPFLNIEPEIAPPGAVMEPFDTVTIGGIDHVRVRKPNGQFNTFWLVNGLTPVPYNTTSLGAYLEDYSGAVAIDSGSVGYLPDTIGWGPKPGSWVLFPFYLGFSILSSGVTYTFFNQLVTHGKQHEVNHVKVQLSESLPYNGAANSVIWARDGTGARFNLGFNPILVHDGLLLNPGESIDAYIRGDAIAYGDYWELNQAACIVAGSGSPGSPGSQNQPAANTHLYDFGPDGPDSPDFL